MVCLGDFDTMNTYNIDLVRDREVTARALGKIWVPCLERTLMHEITWNMFPQERGLVTYRLDEIQNAFSAVGNRQYKRRYRVGHYVAGQLLLEYMASSHLYVKQWAIRESYISVLRGEIADELNKDNGFRYPYDEALIGAKLHEILRCSYIPRRVLEDNETRPENIKGTVYHNILACLKAFATGFFSIFKRGK